MTATKHTIASVRKLARLRWGNKADIRIALKAMDATAKEASRIEWQAMKERRDRAKAERLALGNTAKELAKAARFAVDVDAQEPSLSQLRDRLERHELSESLRELYSDLDEQMRKSSSQRLNHRYTVITSDGMFAHQKAYADTLDELATKIEGDKAD